MARGIAENEHEDLRTGLFREVAAYYQIPEAEVERRCASALATLRHEWNESEDQSNPRTKIENFYESPATIYELIEWHTLQDDTGPLAMCLG